MKRADKRKAGEILGRAKLSEMIITLATSIAEGSYKNAIEKAGAISVLVECCSYDDYWDEKAGIGKYKQQNTLIDLIEGRAE